MTSRADTLPGPRPPASVPLRNWALAAIALVALALAFADSLRAGMPNGDLQQHWRFRIYAFPIVLSQLYYGHPYDYAGYKRLEIAFEPNGVVLEEAAPSLTSIAKVEANGPFLILADDKGIVDFVRLAFTFFGIRTDGLFYTYFAILFVSALCFLIAYFNDRAKLALLAMYFVALLAIMPVFAGFPATVNILD